MKAAFAFWLEARDIGGIDIYYIGINQYKSAMAANNGEIDASWSIVV